MKDLMTNLSVIAAIMAICLGVGYLGGLGISAHSKSPQTTTITKTEVQYIDRIVEKKIYITDTSTTNTTITKPDGTVEHTVVQNNVNTNAQTNESTQTIIKVAEKTVIKGTQNNYSLGVRGVLTKPYVFDTIPQVEIVVGRRLLGDLWLDAGFNKDSKEVSLGFSFQL